MNETRSADAKAAGAQTAGAAPVPTHSSPTSVAAARARDLLDTAQNPAFESYPNLCWTAGPFKPEYQTWTFDPPHYCDICNCLPQSCSNYALHFSRDPACEAQVNVILEGKNAFRNAADVKAGRTPDEVFIGTNQLEDPEAKRQCFQLGWDVALAQAPARELTLARIDRDREERDLKRVEAKMASITESCNARSSTLTPRSRLSRSVRASSTLTWKRCGARSLPATPRSRSWRSASVGARRRACCRSSSTASYRSRKPSVASCRRARQQAHTGRCNAWSAFAEFIQ